MRFVPFHVPLIWKQARQLHEFSRGRLDHLNRIREANFPPLI
jgi:hypothetical protein